MNPFPFYLALRRAWIRSVPLLALLALVAGAAPVGAADEPRVTLLRLIPEEPLFRPVHVAPVPDGSGDLVVVEQAGVIKRFHRGAPRAQGVFLDLRDRVTAQGNEEGLLSVAFHPDFLQHPLLYVDYTAPGPLRSVLASVAYDPVRHAATAGSLRVLLEVAQPFSNHKGGQLVFGPDGMLYMGLGDGGSGGDPHGNGQSLRTLLGKMLRLDVDHPGAGRAYGIPPDNPFAYATDGRLAEIYAYGLRNPWRFSFDRLTGLLYAGDVGQEEVEEVDLIRPGGNYGWNHMEGTRCYAPPSGCDRVGLELPIAEYTHREGVAIVGGYVYRGSALPWLKGHYVFADYGSGTLWSIPTGSPGMHARTVLLRTELNPSSFGEDESGELVVLDLHGAVYQLIPAP